MISFIKVLAFLVLLSSLNAGPLLAQAREREFLLEVLVDVRAETEARTLKSSEGYPLCFPPAEVLIGAEAYIVHAGRGFGGDEFEEGEISGYVDVYVQKTDTPVLLILRANHSVIWRIFASKDADVRAVHLMSVYRSFVTGVPAGVPITSRFRRPLAGGEAENCVFVDPGPEGTHHVHPRGHEANQGHYDELSFANHSVGGRLGQSRTWRHLRERLDDYAGIPISLITPYADRSEGRVNVSRRAVAKFDAVRQRGQDWLANNRPPSIELVSPNAETLAVPDGITGVAAMEWITSQGYAKRTSRDHVEYLCGRDLALALMEGHDLVWDRQIRNCGPRQSASRMFTVLGPIKLTEEICRARDRPALLIPDGVEVDWYPTCTWSRFKYPGGN